MRIPNDVKAGEPVTAAMFNALLACLRSMQLSVAPPLEKDTNPAGTALRLAGLYGARVAKSSGTITVNSGTMLGTGAGNLWNVSPTGALTVGRAIVVKNLATHATHGPIASGKWLVVLPIDQLWLAIWEECTT